VMTALPVFSSVVGTEAPSTSLAGTAVNRELKRRISIAVDDRDVLIVDLSKFLSFAEFDFACIFLRRFRTPDRRKPRRAAVRNLRCRPALPARKRKRDRDGHRRH